MVILRAVNCCVRVISSLRVYASLSSRSDFRRSLRLALRQAHADYTPGPVDPRMVRQPTGVAALLVPVLPVSGSSLEPHTFPVQPHRPDSGSSSPLDRRVILTTHGLTQSDPTSSGPLQITYVSRAFAKLRHSTFGRANLCVPHARDSPCFRACRPSLRIVLTILDLILVPSHYYVVVLPDTLMSP